MKILIVDDEPVTRMLLQKTVQRLGKYEAVNDGRAAINAFKRAWQNWAPFDLITLDIAMTGMNGIEVLSKIREMENEKNVTKENRVKILMLTIVSDKDTIVNCIEAGCDDYIVKPFDRKTLIEKIEKMGLIKGTDINIKNNESGFI